MLKKGNILNRLNKIDDLLDAPSNNTNYDVIISINGDDADNEFYIVDSKGNTKQVNDIDKYIRDAKGKLLQPLNINVNVID